MQTVQTISGVDLARIHSSYRYAVDGFFHGSYIEGCVQSRLERSIGFGQNLLCH